MNGLRFLIVAAVLVHPAFASGQSQPTEPERRQAMRHYRDGQELLSAERWDRAAAAFQSAITLDPLFTDAHYGLGAAYMGMTRYASAVQAFDQCLNAALEVHAWREKNRVEADRRIDDEIKEMRETIQRMQRQPQRNLRSQQMQQRLSDLARSKSSLAAAYEAPAGVLLALGSAHFRNGNRTSAESNWSDAVRINPKLGEAWNNLAAVYLTSERIKEAAEAVENAERAGFRVNPRLKNDIAARK